LDLQEIHDSFLSLINKYQGEYFPPETIDSWLDTAQMALFNDYYIQFAKSQRIVDALAPFKNKFVFTNVTTPGGIVTVPSDYFDAIRLSVVVQDTDGITKIRPCPRLNDDELTARINSQIKPPTLMWPVCETIQNWNLQLYPNVPMAGTLSYLQRPKAPVFNYTTVGGVIVYNQAGSTQMLWADKEIEGIILKALEYAGINTREQDLQSWSNQEDQQNILTPNKA
jgi:hypothetical protein